MRDDALDTLVLTNQQTAVAAIGSTLYVRVSDTPCDYDKFSRYPRYLRMEDNLFEKRSWSFDGVIYAREKEHTPPVLDSVAVSVAAFTTSTYPDTSHKEIAERMIEEAKELLNIDRSDCRDEQQYLSRLADECADVFHLLVDMCQKYNIDLARATEMKLIVNLNRVWTFKADVDGQRRHVKPTDTETIRHWAYMFMFDITGAPAARLGDLVTLLQFAKWIDSDGPFTCENEPEWRVVLGKLAQPPFARV